ncbi:hypothetical protein BX600DRAFT_285001 [Xylariales sp. PMI_506]|nr:hypothetical protein BX600DRAFT_285001 [Xylariales sp. PMI_506]
MPTTRSRAACDNCRSRKQKCDEKKPVCSRCRSLNRACVWPRSQKRGPAKGYTEALEQRLRETERVLLRLLQVVDDDTINKAIASSSDDADLNHSLSEAGISLGSSSALEAGGSAPKNAALMSLWNDLPLQSASDVNRWASTYRACIGKPIEKFNDMKRVNPNVARNILASNDTEQLSSHIPMENLGLSIPLQRPQSTPSVPAPESVSEPVVAPSNPAPEQSLSESSLDLPKGFREQFLW